MWKNWRVLCVTVGCPSPLIACSIRSPEPIKWFDFSSLFYFILLHCNRSSFSSLLYSLLSSSSLLSSFLLFIFSPPSSLLSSIFICLCLRQSRKEKLCSLVYMRGKLFLSLTKKESREERRRRWKRKEQEKEKIYKRNHSRKREKNGRRIQVFNTHLDTI